MRTRRSNAGLIVMDVVIGIVIVTVLAAALTSLVYAQRRAITRLHDSREAMRLAERAMAELASAGEAKIAGPRTTVKFALVEAADPPAGWRWVKVQVTHGTGAAELTGLAPASAKGVRP